MKKLLIVLVLVAVIGGAGYLIYKALIPKSTTMYEQYQAYIATIDQTRYNTNAGYRWEVDDVIRTKQAALAAAYNADKKPDEAIAILKGLIASMNKQQYVLNKKVSRNSGQVELVAIYYARLADSYGLKHDEEKKAWALQQSNEYKAEAARLAQRGK
jgi:hypothetical protein